MPYEVCMPKLSDNMEEGTVIRWMVAVGDQVSQGDAIAEVETDKADVEIESDGSGVVRDIVVPEGGAAAVGAVLAVLEGGAESTVDAEEMRRASAVPAESPGPAGFERGEDAQREAGASTPAHRVAGRGLPLAAVVAGSGGEPGTPDTGPVAARLRVSPVARRLAENSGVDLSLIAGSGPAGRIVKSDVVAASAASAKAAVGNGGVPSAGGAAPGSPAMSRMRRTIAARMEKSKREIPHFYVRASIDVAELMKMQEALRADGAVPGVTVTHLLVRAMARTLPNHPRLNAYWIDDSIQLVEEVNIGIVVAVDDGLVVPVLKRAEALTLVGLVDTARGLVDRSRRGKFRPDDLVGGTISISNVGMLDVDELTPIINAPQAAILGVGAVRDRAVVRDGAIGVGKTLDLTLACDHRVLHGVEAGRFLEDLKGALERPLALLMERG